jgi:mannose-1-phosphate guanylyltransferase
MFTTHNEIMNPVREVEREAPRVPATASRGSLWVIVLAGGDGTRLLPLTTALHGEPMPKQFALLRGELSLLQTTLLRARAVAPWEQVVVVATKSHAHLARAQSAAVGGVTVLEQPANLGTAAGLLLPLSYIRGKDPGARVLVLPSDHHVGRPTLFEETLAELTSPGLDQGVVLLGIEPDWPETDYGWILPGRQLTTRAPLLRSVVRFVEKPPPTVAADLLRNGALWNSLVVTGSAEALWALIEERLPRHAEAFSRLGRHIGTASGQAKIQQVYDDLPRADFSGAVLAQASRQLVVATAPPCEWSDWGTPERVFETLAGTRDLERLQGRLRGKKLPFEALMWNA